MRTALLSFIMAWVMMASGQGNARYVNVFIGTEGTGHTFPGPSLPFGMVQPGPDNTGQGWNYTSGYQYNDSLILGFSQTRLSGTGISEMGDVLLLPIAGSRDESLKNRYYKESEKATVGYYSVVKKDDVRVELSCTERVAFHKYTFPGKDAAVLADFQHGLCFLTDSLVLESEVTFEDHQTLTGFCHTKNWVERRYFFCLQFERPFTCLEELPRARKERAPRYLIHFQLDDTKILQAKIALSTVSVEGARLNLLTEVAGWNFEEVRHHANEEWAKYLNRIDIESEEKQKTIFYTAMYHFLLQPSNIADVDGKYRGADNMIRQAPGKEYYSTLSIWDIYRGAFPLLQMLAPEKIDGIINTMLQHHLAAGFLPIWTAWGQDNYCMIGNHAIPMILAAVNNGFSGFNQKEALKAMVETSTKSHINSDWELYNQYGYYPFDKLDNEAVSRTLESGFDDWCVAELAEKLGDSVTAATFYKRADYYRNLFDQETTLFRGKDSHKNWRIPFDPLAATSPMNNPGDYTEANAWQYFWTPAQYDIAGITALLGGRAAFAKKLNDFFMIEAKNPDKFLGQEAMIGQYAHGNEPGHHIAYLYAYTDEPKTGQKHIHRILNEFYGHTPDGMIGNDDCGQMSAWYILSSLGFYPVNPSGSEFVLGTPNVKKATLKHSDGSTFVMEARNLSKQNIFAGQAFFNGIKIDVPFISYQQIMGGGNLIFEMTNQ